MRGVHIRALAEFLDSGRLVVHLHDLQVLVERVAERMEGSPLADGAAFARRIEVA
jgi:hypothetical protein